MRKISQSLVCLAAKHVMAQVRKLAVNQLIAVLVMAKVKYAFNKVFSQCNKPAHNVMAVVQLFQTLVLIVVVKGEFEKIKSYRLKYRLALMKAIKYAFRVKVKMVEPVVSMATYMFL